jgi:exodeoxyribonuclease-5
MADPMLRLEEIHRQARNNPILRLATAFREGRIVPAAWQDKRGSEKLLGRRDFYQLISPHCQIICGFNETRHAVNARVREKMGVSSKLIFPGETLICLKNNKTFNIFNGQQVTVLDVVREGPWVIELEVETDDRIFTLPVLREQFGTETFKDFKQKGVALMDYGYCLTAHKAQGSEWDEVLVLEEIKNSRNPKRWRYMVATRAKKRLIYCW